MREGRTLVVDTSSGIAVWDDERGTAKMDLGDGRWLVLTVIMTSWVPSKAARTERAEDRARLLSGLREAYGARLEHAQVENPRASMAGKILLFCFLMALALAILAILGVSGMLD
jgi:hypothetical protein